MRVCQFRHIRICWWAPSFSNAPCPVSNFVGLYVDVRSSMIKRITNPSICVATVR